MLPLITAIFLASLLGSLHCAGMCGAFLAIAVSPSTSSRPAALQATYHLGRLISYALLGAAAGSAGSLLNLSAALVGIRPLAASLAGATMVLFGTASFLRTRGLHLRHLPLPAAWTRTAQRAHAAALALPPSTRAFSIGLLTTMLPCGWLYAFAVTAAGTASPAKGALAMAAFWLGTLPALVTLGTALQRLTGPLARRLPAAAALLLVAVGLYTLATRTLLNPLTLATRAQAALVASHSLPNPHTAPCCTNQDDHDDTH